MGQVDSPLVERLLREAIRLSGQLLSLQEQAATKADLVRLALVLASLQAAFVVVLLLVVRA